ncbi:hypothetical protein EPO56_01235 [Patescibacteria group bacterium]|nr:MAG: hypothetical protein EPO56_01235 [Patescibacteria group bacterium]
MEERVKTSFIPKSSLKVERSETRSRNPLAIVNIITGALLVVAIFGAGGMYAFEKYTMQSIASKKLSLERSRAAFEPATIRELARLDARINTGYSLLRQHVSVSQLFDEIETRTLSSVRFNDFSYSIADASRVLLTASGEAVSFNAVALQSDAFSKSSIITEPIFSNVNISKTGTIVFNFSAIIDTSRIGYTGAAVPSSTQQ